MTVAAPRYSGSHPDRDLNCQEAVEPELQRIINDATTHGWATIETINAIEEVVKNFRVAYAEDPDPTEKPPKVSGGEPDPTNDWPAANP
ncbi:hypothetical protein OE766_03550 [Pararhizobium sp. YC-54]|uniref:hypothetical protein n=1 Tax=Pararhizobium sp. YC-54 TaxID=2986920 RepID=UPI0021F79251|nr:hypothetical protein [Pararhizobium sp. YC-54]MCV9997312.1 hypothetical protein [Pararhizobium sp. YC-54]